MPKQTKICRVCGATYEACRNAKSVDGTFNWREVACSPECGMKYLHNVMVSRGEVDVPKKHSKAKHTVKIAIDQTDVVNDDQNGFTFENSNVDIPANDLMNVDVASDSEATEKE